MEFNAAGEMYAGQGPPEWKLRRLLADAIQAGMGTTVIFHVTSLPPRPGPAARIGVDRVEVLVPCPLADRGTHPWGGW